jgi:hypothetical protein
MIATIRAVHHDHHGHDRDDGEAGHRRSSGVKCTYILEAECTDTWQVAHGGDRGQAGSRTA